MKQFEVIVRKKCNIKPKTWVIKVLSKIRSLLNAYLPKSKKKFLLCSVTTLITDNKEIKKLNYKYRKKNKATDVLSFHLNKKYQLNQRYLGDIAISLETAKKEAKKNKITLNLELKMLLVHAYLHLLGYDHNLKSDAKKMFFLQNKVLEKL